MKKQILLPFVLLGSLGMVTALAACQPKEAKPEEGYGVAISNKDELLETFYAGTSRAIEIDLTPAGNVMQEFTTGALTIESSNAEVASITGTNVNALAEGEATITVKYHGWVDTVDLTISAEQPEPAHVAATVNEILQNLADGKEKDVIYEVEAYVVAWQTGKTDATKYGNYMLADAADETDASKQILVYGSSANTEAFTITWSNGAYSYTQGDDAKDFLTNDVTKDVGIGSKIKLEAIAYKYNTTPEISGIVKTVDNSGVVHHDIPEPAVVESSLAAFKADTQGNGAKAFHFSAEIKAFKDGSTKDKYGNMTLTDGTNDLTVYGSTATATALAWSSDAGMYAFTNPKDFDTNASTKDMNVGDTVEVKFIRADYNGAVQGTGIILSSTPGQGGGGQEEVPEPAVATKTLAEFKAVANSKALAYNVTAEVKTCAGDQYGNMTLTDGTNDLTIYGSTATATALVWNKADSYSFTNPKDFNTNTTTKNIKAGDTVTMKLIRSDYNGAIQGQGIITNVVPGAAEESYPVVEANLQLAASYNLSAYAGTAYVQNDGKTAGLTEANALAIFNGGESSVTVTGTNCVTAATGSKYYQAVTSQGPGYGLKLGTGSAEGYVILTCNKNIGKIVITVKAWSATKLATVKINEQASTTLVAADFTTAKEISLVLENTTKQVKISSSIYSNIQSIALYEMPVAQTINHNKRAVFGSLFSFAFKVYLAT